MFFMPGVIGECGRGDGRRPVVQLYTLLVCTSLITFHRFLRVVAEYCRGICGRSMTSVVCVIERRAFLYIVVQSVGAVVGAALLKALSPDYSDMNVVVCTPMPNNDVSMGQVFGIELFLTFVLVMTVFATCDSNRTGIGGSGPLAIGLAIAMCHLWAVRAIRRPIYTIRLLSAVTLGGA